MSTEMEERRAAVELLKSDSRTLISICKDLGYTSGGNDVINKFVDGRAPERLKNLYDANPGLRERVAEELTRAKTQAPPAAAAGGEAECPANQAAPPSPAADASQGEAPPVAVADEGRLERQKAIDILLGAGTKLGVIARALDYSGGGTKQINTFVDGRSQNIDHRLRKLYETFPGLREKVAERLGGPPAPPLSVASGTAPSSATPEVARIDRQLAVNLLLADKVKIKDICAALGYASATKKSLQTFIDGRSRNLEERTASLLKAFPALRDQVDAAKSGKATPVLAVAASATSTSTPAQPAPVVEASALRTHSTIGLKNKAIDTAAATELLEAHVEGRSAVLSVTEVCNGSWQALTAAAANLKPRVRIALFRGQRSEGSGHHFNIIAVDEQFFEFVEMLDLRLKVPFVRNKNEEEREFKNSPLVILRERFGLRREFACTTVHLQPAPSPRAIPSINKAFASMVQGIREQADDLRRGIECVIGGDFNFFLNGFVPPQLAISGYEVLVVNNGARPPVTHTKPEYLGLVVVRRPASGPTPSELSVVKLSETLLQGTGTDHPHVVSSSL